MKKRKLTKKIIAINMISMILFGQIMCQKMVFGEDEGNVYVYCSNGNYEVVTDVTDGAAVEILAGIGDSSYANVKFSSDGNYMYYIAGCESNAFGNLWRCEYRKLESGAVDNEKYCQPIAEKVDYSNFIVTNKGVVFQDDNFNLYFFDGNTVRGISENVNKFWCSEDGEKIVFECGADPVVHMQEEHDMYSSPKQILYGINTSNMDKVLVLATEYLEVFDVTDFDNILFMRASDQDEENDIYVTDFASGPRYLGKLISGMRKPENETVYYTKESENEWTVDEICWDSRGETQEFEEMRESFNENYNSRIFKNLYAYKKGQERKIDVLIQSAEYLDKTVMYTTIKNLIPIDLAMDDWTMQTLIDQNAYYWLSDYKSEPVHMIDQGGYWEMYEQNADLYINNQDLLIEENGMGGNRSLAWASAANEITVFDSFIRIAQGASVLAIDESAIYYEVDRENGEYCDIYKLVNGTSICIAQDVEFGIIYLYSDGSTTARSYNNSLILTEENGNRHEVANNVSQYVRADESTVLYISDYNVWIYQNGERRLLGNNADRVWCSNPMEQIHYLGYTYSLH